MEARHNAMPISADIYADWKPQPMATLADLAAYKAKLQEQQSLTAERQSLTAERNATVRQKADAAAKAQREQAIIDQTFQQFSGPEGPDQKAIVNRLYQVAPDAAQKVETAFAEIHKKAADAKKSELENQDKTAAIIAQRLQGVKPETYKPTWAMINAVDPEMGAFLGPEYDPTTTPAKIETAVAAGTARSEYNKQYKDILDAKKSDTEKALGLISIAKDEAHGQDAMNFAKVHGVTDELQAMGFGQWTPDAPQRATDLLLGPKERATLQIQQTTADRQAAALAETQRHNLVDESIARGNLAARQQEAGKGAAGADIPMVGSTDPNAPHGDDFLKTLPQADQQMVKALAEGRQPWPSSFALRTPYWAGLIQKVFQYDPTFDTAQASNNSRLKVRNDFTSGKSAQQINALNTVVGHLGTLADAADKLNNTSIPFVNSAKNFLKSSTGNPAVVNFDTAKEAVASELVRVWRQAGGSEQDIQGWKNQISSANSPQQLHAAFSQIGHLLESKLGSLQEQYQQGMGISKVNVITPEARRALDRLEGIRNAESGKPASAGADPLSIR